jgi:hypothetical protein
MASNIRMMNEQWTVKDVEENNRGLICGTILRFSWTDWGKLKKIETLWGLPVSRPRFETGTSGIQVKDVTAWTKFLGLRLQGLNKTTIKTMTKQSVFRPTFETHTSWIQVRIVTTWAYLLGKMCIQRYEFTMIRNRTLYSLHTEWVFKYPPPPPKRDSHSYTFQPENFKGIEPIPSPKWKCNDNVNMDFKWYGILIGFDSLRTWHVIMKWSWVLYWPAGGHQFSRRRT